jgi:hypothetical protein
MNERNSEFTESVIREARSYLGVSFSHQGRSRLGIDCVGLVIRSLEAGGYQPRCPETFYNTTYRRTPDPQRLTDYLSDEADCFLIGYNQDKAEFTSLLERVARPCDILLMAYRSDNNQSRHIALVTECNAELGLRIIHTNAEFGCVKEHLLRPTYCNYVTSLWRLKDLS